MEDPRALGGVRMAGRHPDLVRDVGLAVERLPHGRAEPGADEDPAGLQDPVDLQQPGGPELADVGEDRRCVDEVEGAGMGVGLAAHDERARVRALSTG